MPELPEVEITRRHLQAAMTDKTILAVEVNHERTARNNSGSAEVMARLLNRAVKKVGRIGKFLVAPLDDGQVLVAHLGMSGRFAISNQADDRENHTHFIARFADRSEVRFVDPRTFGFVAVLDDDELRESGVSRLGADAWDDPPSAASLHHQLQGRHASIKAILLDQSVIAGMGNIYADEALFLARIHPLRTANSLTKLDCQRLMTAIHQVLSTAIDAGGTSLDDLAYLIPDGRSGENLGNLNVYGRTGQPCPNCGAAVSRVLVRARSSHFCDRCQSL